MVQALCSWRQDDARFCVQYAAGALMAYDVGGVTCTPRHVRRSLEGMPRGAHHGHSEGTPRGAHHSTSMLERMIVSASAR